jgi:hypothetical protein
MFKLNSNDKIKFWWKPKHSFSLLVVLKSLRNSFIFVKIGRLVLRIDSIKMLRVLLDCSFGWGCDSFQTCQDKIDCYIRTLCDSNTFLYERQPCMSHLCLALFEQWSSMNFALPFSCQLLNLYLFSWNFCTTALRDTNRNEWSDLKLISRCWKWC